MYFFYFCVRVFGRKMSGDRGIPRSLIILVLGRNGECEDHHMHPQPRDYLHLLINSYHCKLFMRFERHFRAMKSFFFAKQSLVEIRLVSCQDIHSMFTFFKKQIPSRTRMTFDRHMDMEEAACAQTSCVHHESGCSEEEEEDKNKQLC